MIRTDRRIAVGGVASAAICCLWAVVGPENTTGAAVGVRRFTTPEVSHVVRVSQSFVMDADGLFAVEVRPVATGPVRGAVRFELRAASPVDGPVVRHLSVEASELVRSDRYRFEFQPVQDSLDRAFRFDLASSPDAPSAGVALRATRGEWLDGGTLLFNGRERWGDLGFQTYSTAPPWRRRTRRFAFAALALSCTGVVLLLNEWARVAAANVPGETS